MRIADRKFTQLFLVPALLVPTIRILPESWPYEVKFLLFGSLLGWFLALMVVKYILGREEYHAAEKKQKQAYKDLFK